VRSTTVLAVVLTGFAAATALLGCPAPCRWPIVLAGLADAASLLAEVMAVSSCSGSPRRS
jgi:hypothetical protein